MTCISALACSAASSEQHCGRNKGKKSTFHGRDHPECKTKGGTSITFQKQEIGTRGDHKCHLSRIFRHLREDAEPPTEYEIGLSKFITRGWGDPDTSRLQITVTFLFLYGLPDREQIKSYPVSAALAILPPVPPGDIWWCLEVLLIVTSGERGGPYWHLVGRDQKCCFSSYSAQHGSLLQGLVPNVKRAQAAQS